MNERANRMKWPKGPAKYKVAMVLELPKFKPIEYSFTIDGKAFTREAMLIAVGNGNSYGGGMKVCPNADLRDGMHYRDWETDRKSTRLNSSHLKLSRMPSSA